MRTLAFIIFILFCAYVLIARWYFVCEVRGLCNEASKEEFRWQNLKLVEKDTIIYDGFDQFAFDSAAVAPRLNTNNIAFLDTIAYYLDEFPEKNLTITSFYRVSEIGIHARFSENIGIARAKTIRKELTERGIEEQRVTIDHGISEDSLLLEPLLFEIYLIPEDFDKVHFRFNNMTFSDDNFASDSDEFRPGVSFIAYADSVKTYLELNPEKRLTIIGHTDNTATDEYNLNLGKARAQSAKEYFQELGITSEILIESRGEGKPVATNKTAAGRQKNRRVNFLLQ